MSSSCQLDPHSSVYLDSNCCAVPKQLTVSETDLYFQLTLDGDRTPMQTVTVTNTGKGRVDIKKVVLTRGASDFIILNNNSFPAFITAGQSFNIIVDFTARYDGKTIGLLEIYTNEDRLPYVIGLYSRVRMPDDEEGGSDSDLYARIIREERKRASEDIRITGELIAGYTAKVLSEATLRANADTAEANTRSAQDALVQAHANYINGIEANTRYLADEEILRRLALVEQAQTDNTVFGVDAGARAMIRDEIIIRVSADEAEAIARRTLEASLVTAISEANAKIVEESRVYANRYEAVASRTATIEASYQTVGQVTAIADARLRIEQVARATAISAETTVRESQVASLRTTVNNGLANESILREAAILVERNARVGLASSTATSLLALSASMTGGRGVTPNGTFEAGQGSWTGMTISKNSSGVYTAKTPIGVYAGLFDSRLTAIDPTHAYQLNSQLRITGGPSINYVGVQCYDENKNNLGNIYVNNATGQAQNGILNVNHTYAGERNVSIPYYGSGLQFIVGTRYVSLLVLGNYPNVNGNSVAGSQTEVFSLWLDDITNSYAVNARVTDFSEATTTALGSLTTRITTSESNYVSANNRINGLVTANGDRALEIIQANARITNEENTRANAISAEATRATNLVAALRVDAAGWNSATDARVTVEEAARTTADAAIAARSSVIEATFGTSQGQIGRNSNFAIWFDNQTYPDGWGSWGDGPPANGIQRIASTDPNYKWVFHVNAYRGYQSGLSQGTPELTNSGTYLVDVEVELIAGSWIGSGWASYEGLYPINFATVADVNGVISSTLLGKRRWTVSFNKPANHIAGYHVMFNWNSFGNDGKVLNVNYCRLWKADAGLLKSIGLAADLVTTNTRITTEETTRATAIAAEATRVNGLLTNYATTGALNTAVSAETTARTNAISNAIAAEVSRVDSLVANYATNGSVDTKVANSSAAEVTARAAAIANAVAAEATRSDGLRASLRGEVVSWNNDRYAQGVAIDARVDSEATTRAQQDGALSSRIDTVTATANGAQSTASTALTASQNLATGYGQARVRLLADAGNGRAQIDVWSDSYGQAGIDLVGNVRINGDLGVTGSFDTRVIKNNAVTTFGFIGSVGGYGVSETETIDSADLNMPAGAGALVKVDVQLAGSRISGSGSGIGYCQLFQIYNGQEAAISDRIYFSPNNRANPVYFTGISQVPANQPYGFRIRMGVEGSGSWSFSGGAIIAVEYKK